MVKTVEAVFDGKVFEPTEPIELKPNTRVRISVEAVEPSKDEPKTASFLQTARALNLDGPPDWSANLDAYLYGDKDINAE
jgi:predicted DNA-binding antitoxin AbrB/MazE fold protein